jgi:hypothetical protein
MTVTVPKKTALWLSVATYAFLVFVAVLVLLLFARLVTLTEDLHNIAETNRSNGNLLVQCTTPPEQRVPPVKITPENRNKDCYARAQQRILDGDSANQAVIIAAAACGSAHPGNPVETERCMKSAIERLSMTKGRS